MIKIMENNKYFVNKINYYNLDDIFNYNDRSFI